MTFEDRVRALEPLGFSPRQARFVVTVALHGGYCLRRHYTAFAGIRYGRVVRDFLDSLVTRQLARRVEYRTERGYLYHLHAKSIYRALQQDNNRNRRRARPERIAIKLMLLDFVLTCPDVEWLVTEQDKVVVFSERFGVSRADLPQRAYASHYQRTAPTARYFVHKLPIYLAGDPSRVHFVVPVAALSPHALEEFLADHARLLSHLSTWAIVAVRPVSAQQGLLEWRAAFDGFLARIASPSLPDRAHAARYFAIRRSVEQNDLRPLSVADLNYFREARPHFAGASLEALYARWLIGGDAVLLEPETHRPRPGSRPGQLLTHELPFAYEQFRELRQPC